MEDSVPIVLDPCPACRQRTRGVEHLVAVDAQTDDLTVTCVACGYTLTDGELRALFIAAAGGRAP
jgi:hypothetical protein